LGGGFAISRVELPGNFGRAEDVIEPFPLCARPRPWWSQQTKLRGEREGTFGW